MIAKYHSDRTQFVQVGKEKSSVIPNDCGVPQGDVLAPTLLSLHTDSLHSVNDCMLRKYADDIAVYSPAPSDTTSLSVTLQYVATWAENNSLFLNESKCVECVFSLCTQRSDPAPLRINGIPILRNTNVKYFGLTLPSNLTWTAHVESVFNRDRKIRYVMKRLRKAGALRDRLVLFIDIFILPLILYCPLVAFPCLLRFDFKILRG